MSQEITTERAKLNFSFKDASSQEVKDEISRKVEAISREVGFNARVTPTPTASDTTDTQQHALPRTDRRARTKTGRTYPFNTKIKPETYDTIAALSDRMTEREGRYVSLAEVIEKAVALLDDRSNDGEA